MGSGDGENALISEPGTSSSGIASASTMNETKKKEEQTSSKESTKTKRRSTIEMGEPTSKKNKEALGKDDLRYKISK